MSAFSPCTLDDKVEEILRRYPASKRSAAMPVLHLIQENCGHIPADALEWAAGKLDMQPVQLMELVTFYPMYRQRPAGRYHIKVCRTLSCTLNGGKSLLDHLLRRLGVGLDETTSDGRFSVSQVECLASCHVSPCLMINDELHEGMTQEKIDAILSRCA
ncbi:MAG: NAD(P)H-dependent oxidoreductase subunit E [Verrucomicrobiae bacterium]|nr:NAD(P)H-dependent oxidoreductase subunit E [Verrucomicrobiae bacterium]